MRFALTLLLTMLLLPALHASAEGDEALPGEFGGCSPPESPAIPDGGKVDTDEMKRTVSLVKAYLKQGEDYLACLTEVENSWGDEATQEQRKELIHNHNTMVEAMQAAAERFNSELAKYRAQEQ
jgi:hypothetical protein